MPRARQTIRGKVETLLTGLTTTGANVYANRVYPHDTLPCISIYTLSESVLETTLNGAQTRLLNLIVEGRAKVNDTLDDTLDTIALEIETALLADQELTGSAKILELSETEIEIFDDLEKPAGVMRLLFSIHYRVNETDPGTIIQ